VKSSAKALKELLNRPGLLPFPCCFDALSARLIERSGFALTFMSGFAVSAVRLGAPDTGLISYGEMVDQGRNICSAVSIPVIGDGDTGYGNAINVKRTVRGYADAGFAGVMIEDQVAPKRCGHTRGKAVVSRDEALARIRAAVDAREEGSDILIMARTDSLATDGLEESKRAIRPGRSRIRELRARKVARASTPTPSAREWGR
jgi:2-methylisocitrate lyase-like PEP mutase family enzyme